MQNGTGDLWIWKKDGSSEHRTIRVEKISEDEIKPALAHALSQLDETEVFYAGNGVILRGTIHGLSECARIKAIVQGFPSSVHDETVTAEEVTSEAQKRLEKWIKQSGYGPKLTVERWGSSIWVRGSIENPSQQARAEKELHAIYSDVQTEIDSMPDHAPTVHFKVFLLELKKTGFRHFGISWPESAPAFHLTTSSVTNIFQLDTALQMLEGEGNVKILSNPELVVRAPGEAELFSGGELPIEMQSHFFSSVTWKNFGLTLQLKVTQTTAERVRLDISTEVSHLDTSIGNDKIPGIQSNRMKTQVDARYGVPLFLSGLLQKNVREQAHGLPWLRQLPILGALFGSDDYLSERSELVAILVPSSTPPPAPMDKVNPTVESESYVAKGKVPPPRNWLSPAHERALRASPEFPWNALR